MTTHYVNRQWVTPTRFMLGLGIFFAIGVIGTLVAPMPWAGLFFGTGLTALTMLLMTGGYFWMDARRRRRAAASG